MTPERYRLVGQIYHAALELEPCKRADFLAGACGNDQDIYREVESLLAAHLSAGDYFAAPALELAARLIPREETESLIGHNIGHYQIVTLLGKGGMGEVYLAQDTRLGRKVAIKLLPKDFTKDQERVRRFEREARAISALNHPNIITIHEIGWAEDRHFIVTEYIEGETLRWRMTNGPLHLETAVEIAIQIASALVAAHELGIVHRDIKPENIMVRRDELVKVLDFGLAKLVECKSAATDPDTLTIIGGQSSVAAGIDSVPGLIMGTPQYMSPEQVRGDKAEAPSDIFSMGVVLFEMITGNRPFTGNTQVEVMAAILEKELVPLAQCDIEVPQELEKIISKALAKNREERYHAANEFRLELKDFLRELNTETHRHPQVSPQPIPTPEGERRQAAVICSSLTGYSALVEQLAPEEAEQTITRIKTSTAEIVRKHRGTMIRHTGESMTALFGLPAIHEDDFVRAVRAGLEFHARVREITGELELRLSQPIRSCTGINNGSILTHPQCTDWKREEKYEITGEALQIATLLAAQAEPDEILIAQETRRLVAPYFKTEAGQPLPLKSRSAPAITYRVLGESGVQTRLEAAQVLGLTRYTGREKELITLQTVYDKALKREGQFVTIVGEAGVGKSRLLLEFRRRLGENPAIILEGRCQPYGGNIPYQPFIDILRDVLDLQGSDTDLVTDAVSGIRAIDPNLEVYIPLYFHLLSLPSDQYSLPAHLQGEELRLAILEALSAIFTLRTQSGPVVLFLEDWHWADEGSEEALKKLIRMAADYPLIIIATCRPDRPFNWAYLNHHTQLYLGPLATSPSIRIMKSIFEADHLPQGLGDLLYRRSGGNPFFIEEVCLTLIENGKIQVADRSVILNDSLEEFDLPDTVQAVIRARLDRLDRETQKVLLHSSVIGQEFSRSILERTFESGYPLSRCLEKLQTLGLVHQLRVLPEAVYQFNHLLTQEVAYESMLLHQRRSLHETVGRAIEDSSHDRVEGRMDILAYHFSCAENWTKAVRYGHEAAERNIRLIRFFEALGMLVKVEGWLLKLPESDKRKETLVQVLLEEERLCETLGLRERQQALIDRTLSLLDPASDQAQLAEVYIRQGELYTLLKRFAEAQHLLSESLDIRRSLSDRAGECRTLRSLGFLCWQQGRNEEALAYNQSALAIDRASNDAAGYTLDLTNLGTVLRAQGKLQEALETLEDAIRVSATIERLFLQVYVLGIIANVYRDLGEIEKAIQYLQQSIDIAKQNRMPIAQILDMINLISLCWEHGQEEESLRHCRELVSLARSLDIKSEMARALSIYGQHLTDLGRVEDAHPILFEAAELFFQLGDREKELLVLTGLACIGGESADGQRQPLTIWQRIRELRKERNELPGEIAALKQMAKLARTARDKEPALQYYREALDLATRMDEKACQGELLNAMGIVEWEHANYDRALEHYQQAWQIFEELNDQPHAGLMLNSIAVTLKAMERLGEAQSRLAEAIQIHRASGQKLFEGHALAVMGDISRESGLRDNAADHYRASLELRREINDLEGEGWMLHRLAEVYLTQGASDRAGDLLGQALTIANETGSERLKQACIRLQV
jgi:serine/threonine protein kinase/tetratricopeptide (TPR) repeat protein